MSKITFRADEELVERVEGLDTSKSEVMREALRAYLDEHSSERSGGPGGQRRPPGMNPGPDTGPDAGEESTLDELVAERVDAMLAERLEAASVGGRAQDIDLTISLEGVQGATVDAGEQAHGRESRTSDGAASDEPVSDAPAEEASACGQCGTELSPDHVYCPNCGEKATRRVFCECGDEIRSDWSFCPGCGRRTPAADVLDNG